MSCRRSARSLALSTLLLAMIALPPVHGATKFTQGQLVYTSDMKAFKEGAIQPLFEKLLSGQRPIVLFIHGRGKEPGKSLEQAGPFARLAGVEGRAVEKLESYGNAVLLFSWDSKRGRGFRDRSLPLSKMPDSAKNFKKVLDELARALAATEAAGIKRPPITLLAHSMGTIVLQTYIQSAAPEGWPKNGRKLFDTVVLSSSDADDVGHAAWVGEVARRERVIVTVNPEDPVLVKSTDSRPTNAKALGLAEGKESANTATYVHFCEDAHEVFKQRPQRKDVTEFFAGIFGGKDGPLGDPITGRIGHYRLRDRCSK